jgi:hypothetical protein
MKEAMSRCDIMIFLFDEYNRIFYEPIVEGAPSLQIPKQWFHYRPQDSK